MVIGYYKSKDFPASQLVWTDRNADFKFREVKKIGIFTPRHCLELNMIGKN